MTTYFDSFYETLRLPIYDREETASIAEEYAGAAAELASKEEELVQCREQLEAATRACEQERRTSVDAAALASASSLRRAELEDENAQLVEALINTKVSFAETAQRYEEDKKKVWTMKRRLQRYATRVASLEVAETLRSQNFASPAGDTRPAQIPAPARQPQQTVPVRQPMQPNASAPQSQQFRQQPQMTKPPMTQPPPMTLSSSKQAANGVAGVESGASARQQQRQQLQPPKGANRERY